MTHYYSPNQNTDFEPFKIIVSTKKGQFEIYSSSGVFSKKKLDNASKLLIENAEIKQNQKVLDLGCGYGVMGMALKKFHPSLQVTLSDISQRALKLARLNKKELDLDVKIKKSDLFSNINEKFDVIITNPPYAAGRQTCFDIITQSINFLKPGGTLQLVARHKKGGKVLGEKIQEVYGNLDDSKKGSGFRIYKGKKTC